MSEEENDNEATELALHNAEYDAWQAMSESERAARIKWMLRNS